MAKAVSTYSSVFLTDIDLTTRTVINSRGGGGDVQGSSSPFFSLFYLRTSTINYLIYSTQADRCAGGVQTQRAMKILQARIRVYH